MSETIDWVTALVALDRDTLDADAIEETLGVVLKSKEDLEARPRPPGGGAARSRDRAKRVADVNKAGRCPVSSRTC